MDNVALCGVAKDEGPYLIEWVAYHKLLGFDIFIADNGGDDKTSEILCALHNAGYIYRLEFRNVKRPQLAAYRALLRVVRKRGYTIAGFLDMDEFFSRSFPLAPLTPKNGSDYIKERFAAQDLTQLSFHWITYGGKTDIDDITEPVLSRFCWHSHPQQDWNVNIKSFVLIDAMFSFKNIFYLGPFLFGVHFFHAADKKWLIDDSSRPYSPSADISHNTGCVLHFQCKTWDEYKAKIRKGSTVRKVNKNSREYFDRYNYNDIYTAPGDMVIRILNAKIKEIKRQLRPTALAKQTFVEKIVIKILSLGTARAGDQNGFLYRKLVSRL